MALRTVYALCLLGATWNHAAILFQHGIFWDYGGVPRASAVFWTLLTVLDPAAAILLLVRPTAGVAATAAIIVMDVIHNLRIQTGPLLETLSKSPRLLEQMLFMVFVLATMRFAVDQRSV